jgi:flagellum-specific ATP synthase
VDLDRMTPSAPVNRLDALRRLVSSIDHPPGLVELSGTVSEAAHTHVAVTGLSPFLKIGDHVEIGRKADGNLAEVARIEADRAILMPFARGAAVRLGDTVRLKGDWSCQPNSSWKGRTFDALANPIDGLGPLTRTSAAMHVQRPGGVLNRRPVGDVLKVGVKAIDVFTPICAGQRLGIFAGSGVGKSTLLGMLTNAPDVTTVVFSLIGERGREAREFLESLGETRSRVIAVVATSDESPMMRRLAPKTAMSIAEHLSAQGEHVLLILDSLTRFAHAQREYALAADEPPVARGYPPSVFSEMAHLLERAGPGESGKGCITAIASVLVDGDDHNDPVADSLRGLLDGHIVLDRSIAEQGRLPAVNVLSSISRLATRAWTPTERMLVAQLRQMISRFEDTRDLRLLGGYHPGQDRTLDAAIAAVPKIYEYLKQAPDDPTAADPFLDLTNLLAPQVAAKPRA